MANRRMFSLDICDSDAFLDLPLSSQALYFHLGLRADDDGMVGNPKKILRMIGASEDDLKLLITKKFVLPFDSGVLVIKHWKINNYIRSDRYKPTNYTDEIKMLSTKENGSYTFGIPTVDHGVTQDRIGKDSIDKESIDKYSVKPETKESATDRINNMMKRLGYEVMQ